jgi:hypothetical protein
VFDLIERLFDSIERLFVERLFDENRTSRAAYPGIPAWAGGRAVSGEPGANFS